MGLKGITINTLPEAAAHIYAEDDAAIYQAIIGSDRVLDIGEKFKAEVINSNTVRVYNGVVVIGGHVARIVPGDYQDMTIENGTAGKKRNDLIVARFMTTGNAGTDDYTLAVVKGAAGDTAADPSLVQGDLYNGAKQRELALWRVKLDGVNITDVERVAPVGPSLDSLNMDIEECFQSVSDGKSLVAAAITDKGVTTAANAAFATMAANVNAIKVGQTVVYLGQGKSFNVSGYPGYGNFTTANFLGGGTVISQKDDANNHKYGERSATNSFSYNKSTGVLTITTPYSDSWTAPSGGYGLMYAYSLPKVWLVY